MDKHHLYFGSNLKLSKGITESARFAADICALLRLEDLSSVTAFIIPSYLAIPGVRDAIGPEGPLMFGAQNVCAQEQVAYEPVWAIGTAGVPASPEYAQEKHAVIRSALTRVLGPAGGRSPCCTGAASTRTMPTRWSVSRISTACLWAGRPGRPRDLSPFCGRPGAARA